MADYVRFLDENCNGTLATGSESAEFASNIISNPDVQLGLPEFRISYVLWGNVRYGSLRTLGLVEVLRSDCISALCGHQHLLLKGYHAH